AEALDSLTHMAAWTLKAAVRPEHPTGDADWVEAMKTLDRAAGKSDADAALAFQVESAVDVLANQDLDHVEAPRSEGYDNRALTRSYDQRLRTARATLKRLKSHDLDGFVADSGVRDAMDRAFVDL